MANPCVTCGKLTHRLSICAPCVERAESILHVPAPWTEFEKASLHPEIRAEGFHECWKNSRYTVLVRRVESTLGDLLHLSIKRNDKNPLHDWRDLQRIKNEILGSDEEACELYPAESRLVDGANQYHLWSFVGQRAPFGYSERAVMLPGGLDGSKQRAFEKVPDDAMTEDEFQEKLKVHKAKQIAKIGTMARIKEVLDVAQLRPCQGVGSGIFHNVEAPKCEEVWPTDPGYWCGPCIAKLLRKLSQEAEALQ